MAYYIDLWDHYNLILKGVFGNRKNFLRWRVERDERQKYDFMRATRQIPR